MPQATAGRIGRPTESSLRNEPFPCNSDIPARISVRVAHTFMQLGILRSFPIPYLGIFMLARTSEHCTCIEAKDQMMNITLKEEPGRREIEVTIVSSPGDPRASRLVEALRAATGRLVGYAPNGDISQKIIPLDQVLYVETTERRAFIRTMDGTTLESPLRLYELEQALEGTEFMRISRQVLVNFDKVVSIVPEPNSRLILELDGGSRVVVTRSYAPDIRRKLGALA